MKRNLLLLSLCSIAALNYSTASAVLNTGTYNPGPIKPGAFSGPIQLPKSTPESPQRMQERLNELEARQKEITRKRILGQDPKLSFIEREEALSRPDPRDFDSIREAMKSGGDRIQTRIP